MIPKSDVQTPNICPKLKSRPDIAPKSDVQTPQSPPKAGFWSNIAVIPCRYCLFDGLWGPLRCNCRAERTASLDSLTLVELVTVTAVGGVVAGLVVVFMVLFVRPRLASAPATQPDSELAGLVEKAVMLDGQATNLHSLMVELLKEQSGVKAGVASTAEQTAELHRVLANTKHRGDWGEILAEDVPVHAGLVHQVNYVRQQQMRYGRGRPDFTFTMPDGLELNLDAKFPLENYRRIEKAETDDAREKAHKAFAGDIKRHIKTLADRGYGADPVSTKPGQLQSTNVPLMERPSQATTRRCFPLGEG